jgi:thiol-disulfide isomerase/thioredoxin
MKTIKRETLRLSVPGLIIICLCLFVSDCAEDKTPISGEIPSLSLPNLRGDIIDIHKDTSELLLLVFWATWCQPCIMEIPSLITINNRYKDRSFRLISVLTDEPGTKTILKISNEFGINYDILLGEERTGIKFGVRALPTLLLVGRNRKILYKSEGMTPEYILDSKIQSFLSNS